MNDNDNKKNNNKKKEVIINSRLCYKKKLIKIITHVSAS